MSVALLEVWVETDRVEVGMEAEEKFHEFLDLFLLSHESARLTKFGGNPRKVETDPVDRTIHAHMLVDSGEHELDLAADLKKRLGDFLLEHRLTSEPTGSPPSTVRIELVDLSEDDLIDARSDILRALANGRKTRNELSGSVSVPAHVFELLTGYLIHKGEIAVEMTEEGPPEVMLTLV